MNRGRSTVNLKFVSLFIVLFFLYIQNIDAATNNVNYNVSYFGLSESNIYHSYDEVDETKSMLNLLYGDLSYKKKVSRNFENVYKIFVDLELYPDYSNRNKTSFGIVYSPEYRYAHKGSIYSNISFSRRNRELIDDQGVNQNRILKKWQMDVDLSNKNSFGDLLIKQTVYYSNDNYDETVIPTPSGTDSTLRSYDYKSYGFNINTRYKFSHRLKSYVFYNFEKRDYSERRTYTVKYGAFIGRPFEIRKYTENSIGLQINYRVYKKNQISAKVEYTKRKDNFENYYGFRQWQYRLRIITAPAKHHAVELSFRFKNKDYENYYTSRIGNSNRVWVDYADFQVDYVYRLLENFSISVYMQNYNKVSNDIYFDYHNFTAGIGFKYSN